MHVDPTQNAPPARWGVLLSLPGASGGRGARITPAGADARPPAHAHEPSTTLVGRACVPVCRVGAFVRTQGLRETHCRITIRRARECPRDPEGPHRRKGVTRVAQGATHVFGECLGFGGTDLTVGHRRTFRPPTASERRVGRNVGPSLTRMWVSPIRTDHHMSASRAGARRALLFL